MTVKILQSQTYLRMTHPFVKVKLNKNWLIYKYPFLYRETLPSPSVSESKEEEHVS